MTDNLNPDKVRAVIGHALAGLDPEDVAERVKWCTQHGVQGAIMHPSGVGELVEFEFGGRTLAVVPLDVLCGDGPLQLQAEYFTEIPDDASELDDDG